LQGIKIFSPEDHQHLVDENVDENDLPLKTAWENSDFLRYDPKASWGIELYHDLEEVLLVGDWNIHGNNMVYSTYGYMI